MLREIDCVMVRVPDLAAATEFYASVFGLRPLWSDEVSVGMAMPDTGTEIVLHTMDLPADRSVCYVVDDVPTAVAGYRRSGCTVTVEPFDIVIGRCAVVADPYGNSLCVLDRSKGPRTGQM